MNETFQALDAFVGHVNGERIHLLVEKVFEKTLFSHLTQLKSLLLKAFQSFSIKILHDIFLKLSP
jgi:hypothetical protein